MLVDDMIVEFEEILQGKFKICKDCKIKKPISEFYVRSNGKDAGRVSVRCKLCDKEKGRLKRFNSPEAQKKREEKELDAATGTKICRQCKIRKPLGDFYDELGVSSGKRATCKDCHKKNCDLYRENNRELVNERQTRYRETHREELVEKQKERYENPGYRRRQLDQQHNKWLRDPATRERHRRTARNSHLKCKHGITLDQLERQIELQKGKCMVCRLKFTDKGPQRMVIDHCHVTGAFRGLLCCACNSAEGMLKTPETALRLYEYMKEMELLSYQRPNVIVLTTQES
jgi:hypothetical protein